MVKRIAFCLFLALLPLSAQSGGGGGVSIQFQQVAAVPSTCTGSSPAGIVFEYDNSGTFVYYTCPVSGSAPQIIQTGTGSGYVTSFNTRTGAVTLSQDDVSGANGVTNGGTSLTSGVIPVANGATGVANSALTDNGATLTYGGTSEDMIIGASASNYQMEVAWTIIQAMYNSTPSTLTLNPNGGQVMTGATLDVGTMTAGTTALAYACAPSGGGVLTTDSAGTCLASALRFKDVRADLSRWSALGHVLGYRTVDARYKRSITTTSDHRWHPMMVADDVARIAPENAAYEPDGKVLGIRDNSIQAELVATAQAEQEEIDCLGFGVVLLLGSVLWRRRRG